MPITPSFKWEETEHTVQVVVALPGASKTKSDVFATECMLKVNLAPYLLVLDLHGEVDSGQTVATFTANESVSFQLHKKTPGLWGQLSAVGSKDELTDRRNASIDRAHAAMEEARRQRLERKQREEKQAIDRQMEIERLKRQEMERRKNEELAAERMRINKWQKQVAKSGNKSAASATTVNKPGARSGKLPLATVSETVSETAEGDDVAGSESEYETESEEEEEEGDVAVAGGGEREGRDAADQQQQPDHPDYHGKGWWPSKAGATSVDKDGGDISSGISSSGRAINRSGDDAPSDNDEGDDDDTSSRTARHAQHAPDQEDGDDDGCDDVAVEETAQDTWVPLPPPRVRCEVVKVGFTPLEMPHLPARESREAELKVYKQQVKRDTALLADSEDVSDRQPVWLKDKGDGLFKQGNYRGAISAYTRALELDPSLPLVWSNRAAAHSKVGEHQAASEDAGQALTLLRTRQKRFESGDMDDAEIQTFKRQLVRALVRQGAALTALGQLQAALPCYEEAARYDPSNLQLAADLQELHAALLPADPPSLKARAAARFAGGDHAGAVEAFTALLACVKDQPLEQLSGLSNRAAAFLALGDYPAAARDCCAAIALALHQLHDLVLPALVHDDGNGSLAVEPCQQPTVAASATVTTDGACDRQQQTGQQSQAGHQQGGQQQQQQQQVSDWLGLLSRAAHAASNAWAVVGAAGLQQACSVRSAEADDLLHACLAALPRDLAAEGPAEGAGSTRTVAVSGLLGSTARLLARRGAVHGHMKQYSQAVHDFETGAHVMTALNETDKAAALLADAAKMRQLLGVAESAAAPACHTTVMSPVKAGGAPCAAAVVAPGSPAALLHPPSHVC